MKILKAAVIGTGFTGRQHVEALRRVPGIKLTAVADRNPAVRQWCKEQGIPHYYSDYRELLEKEKADIIHNCTPNNIHYEVNKTAIQKGCHIYSEKPLTLTAKEAWELTVEAKKRGLKTAVNFNYRNYAMIHEMKARIQEGRLGAFTHIQAEYLQDWLLYDTDFDWRIQKETGGNSRAAGDIGSHCFDIIQFVTGEKITAVYAKYFTAYEKRKRFRSSETFEEQKKEGDFEEISVETEDSAYILFRLEGGNTGMLSISQVCAGKKNGMKILIGGKKEAVEWEQEKPDRLWVGKRDAGNEILYEDKKYLTRDAKSYAVLPNGHPCGWKDALARAIGDFYHSIRFPEEAYRYADFKDGACIAEIVEACYESSRRGCWIDINESLNVRKGELL